MREAIEGVVELYIRAWSEPDPLVREQLVAACFAVEGRLVSRRRVIQGRVALAADIARFHAEVRWRRVRKLSVIDTGERTFRVRGAVEFEDGSSIESYDVGEVDSEGIISLLITFDGPLAEDTAET